jgi:sulfoquinovose isomerase
VENDDFVSSEGPAWKSRVGHRRWLREQADALFNFFESRCVCPSGGFFELDPAGRPLHFSNPVRAIHGTARMVHSYTIASLLGRPGADAIVDHGMRFLWEKHRDGRHGGYFWSVDDRGPIDATKQGYGHAFVLLAASSARTIGHPLADAMIADVTGVLETKFWEPARGVFAEEFSSDWSPLGPYRGQNSNMHMTEALMAAFEATGRRAYLEKAQSIANQIIAVHAVQSGHRVPEHFTEDWRIDREYRAANEIFRPSGTTPGHWLEWSRLLLQLWVLGGSQQGWMKPAAQALFAQAASLGWDQQRGGFFYTLDWNDRPAMRHKLWWPMAEGAGAASFLVDHAPSQHHENWYRRIWSGIARNHLDSENGGWFEELSESLTPTRELFAGKGDIYHAVQACLIPLYPSTGSLTRVVQSTTPG